MSVCLITDKPDHPLLAALPGLLGRGHSVAVLNPADFAGTADGTGSAGDAGAADFGPPADLYLLKDHSPQALALARELQNRGGRVVNGIAATELCQDRVRMADLARESGLPFPATRHFPRLSDLRAHLDGSAGPRPPLIVKSRASRRQDLVTRIDKLTCLDPLAADWAEEPVVVQGFVPGDGWDHKLWVIGSRVFAGLRRSPLDDGAPATTRPLDPRQLGPGRLSLVRKVGQVFDLRIYGVDILETAEGPVIVDVNPFPGCRGIPGAPEALAEFVRAEVRSGPMATAERRPTGTLPLAALHQAVDRLFTALDGPTGGTGTGPDAAALRVSRVRHKPGRGLTVSYQAHGRRPPSGPTGSSGLHGLPGPLVTARLGESALTAPHVGELLSSAEPAEFHGRWPGVVGCPRLDLTLQSFPHDGALPALPAALATTPTDHRLAAALTAAARTVLDDDSASVAEVRVSLVRYKPGARCVLRYQVRLTSATELVFYGKLYSDPDDAAAAYLLSQRLWDAALEHPNPTPRPVVLRPLALVQELGLVLTEIAGGAHDGGQVTGDCLLRPPLRLPATSGPPQSALIASGAALAWMHTSRVTADRSTASGPAYAARVREWAQALSAAVPALGSRLDRATRLLGDALAQSQADSPALVHGGFKPSQLVFCLPDHPVITDLDGAGQGDPALDVGYFLAYLRPPGLAGRGNTLAWYAAARQDFLGAYLTALASHGTAPEGLAALQRRAAAFEAALLLKIASRRVRRAGSLRPAEVRAVVIGVDQCLEQFAGRPAG